MYRDDEKSLVQEPVEIPNDCLCPITMEMMEDPVMTADGHSYERNAITLWLTSNNRSPKTGAPLAHTTLTANHTLKSIIQEFREKLPRIQREGQIKRDLEEAIRIREEFVAEFVKKTEKTEEVFQSQFQQLRINTTAREALLQSQLHEEMQRRCAVEEQLKMLSNVEAHGRRQPKIQQVSISSSTSTTFPTSSFFSSTSSSQPMRLPSAPLRESDTLVNQLLLHVVHGEQVEAENMLQQKAALLLKTGRVTDYSGRSIEGTALQMALGSYDDRMVKMLLPYFDKVEAGDVEKSRQYEAFLQVADEKKALWDKELTALEEMVTALQNAPRVYNYEAALEKFRIALMTQEVIKGYHFNPELFIKACVLYDKHFDAFGGYDKPKTNLFAVKVIGYIQRFFPANIAQAFCYGFDDVVEKSQDPWRSLTFRYGTESYFPLEVVAGLGFDYLTSARQALWSPLLRWRQDAPGRTSLTLASGTIGHGRLFKTYVKQKSQQCRNLCGTQKVSLTRF